MIKILPLDILGVSHRIPRKNQNAVYRLQISTLVPEIFTQAVRPGFSFRLSFFFFRVQSQIAVWPLERMRHLCSVQHGSFTEDVVA